MTRQGAHLISWLFLLLAPATLASPATDSCAQCHPPLALPEGHPEPASWALADCLRCHQADHRDAAPTAARVALPLLRAMHLGHVESMGFDCTLCHIDAEAEIPDMRQRLQLILESSGDPAHE